MIHLPGHQAMSIAFGDGFHVGMSNGDIQLYGRSTPPYRPNVGAVIKHDTRCSQCGGTFKAGHCITADLAPNMAGVARHTDCDDPKLERTEDDV